MVENCGKQRGFTLIEILVSIILLFIILTSFIGFFTQSAKFTQKNEQKLSTMQTAEKIIHLVETNISKDDLLHEGIINSSGTVTNTSPSFDTINKYLSLSISKNDNINIVFSNESTENLIQVKATVQDNNTSEQSETYTYIRK